MVNSDKTQEWDSKIINKTEWEEVWIKCLTKINHITNPKIDKTLNKVDKEISKDKDHHINNKAQWDQTKDNQVKLPNKVNHQWEDKDHHNNKWDNNKVCNKNHKVKKDKIKEVNHKMPHNLLSII